MAADELKTAIEDVRQVLLAEQEQGPGDRELLTRFVEQRDESAFAALVRRHAPMVWGVCRRTLRNTADVEDAFQATFLVLVRKAASVRPREMVGNFLYGVARQTALKARATAARRRVRERQVAQMPEPEARRELRDDVLPVLDEELGRLPDKYRAVLVLCDLEGQARSVAARHLGLPEGTVASRLARARAMLARRLEHRGLAVTGVSLAAALAGEAAASAPAAVVSAAIRAACALAAGQACAAAVSVKVLSLTEGVVKAMLASRLMKVTAMVLALGTAVAAFGVLAPGGQKPAPPDRSAEPRRTEPSRPAEPRRKEGAARLAAPPAAKAEAADSLPAGAIAQFGSPHLQDFSIDRPGAFSPDGKLLATGGSNSNRPICVWDVTGGALARRYATHGAFVYDLRWKSDGKLAALSNFWRNAFLMQEFEDVPDLPPEEVQRLFNAMNRRDLLAREGKVPQDFLNSCFLSADGRRAVAVWVRVSGKEHQRRAALYPFTAGQTSDTVKPELEIALPSGDRFHGVWLSADGKFLLAAAAPTVGEPNGLHAFDLAAGKDDKGRGAWKISLAGHREGTCIDSCFSPDGKRVVLLLWDGSVESWDGPGGKRIRELPKLPWYFHYGNREQNVIDLAADGKRLVLVDRDASGQTGGRIVDVETGAEVCRLARRPMPARLAGGVRFSADGARVALVGGGAVGIWNAQTGADACPLPGHRGVVNSLAVLPGGTRIVTAGEDLTVRAWDLAGGKEVWRAALPQVVCVKFATPDGVVVLQDRFGGAEAALGLDTATGKPRPLPGDLAAAGKENFLACSPDGATVVTLDTKNPAYRVWSWPAGRLQKTVPLVLPEKFRLVWCSEARFTREGKHFVAVLYCRGGGPAEQKVVRPPYRPFVETLDLAAGKLLRRIEVPVQVDPTLLRRLELSVPNDPVLLLPHPNGLYYWTKEYIQDAVGGGTLARLKRPQELEPSLAWTRGAALAPDGRTVAVGAGLYEQQLLLFETWTGRLRGMLPVPGRSLRGLSFLPDGRLVSVGATATVWSVGLQPSAATADPGQEWELLGEPDAEKAWTAMGKLAGTPKAVEFICRHIRPVPKLADATLERLFRNLDTEEFRDREKASKELDRLGVLAVPKVKARLAAGGSAELKRRLETFLGEHDRDEPPTDELRALRAVEILEAIGTPAARKLLVELAAGEATARLTQDAAAAVQRLGRR